MNFMIARKDVLELMRKFDLFGENEGIYIPMKSTLTFKKGKKFTENMKAKVIKGLTKIHEEYGFEVMGFEFKQIL